MIGIRTVHFERVIQEEEHQHHNHEGEVEEGQCRYCD